MLSLGLMSGTSMDGIDAALLETDGTEKLIMERGHCSRSYAPEFKILLKVAESTIRASTGDLNEAEADFINALESYLTKELKIPAVQQEKTRNQLAAYLQQAEKTQTSLSLQAVIHHSTYLHALTVNDLLNKTELKPQQIDVIGYHGQTMLHRPAEKISVIVGKGQELANDLGITVVSDFRSNDIAMGGKGAPFAPLYHYALALRDGKIPTAIVNCGGIANLTLIPSRHEADILAFDTGPGNGLIDRVVKQRTQGQESMDKDGHYGKQGKISETVLKALFEKSIIQDGKNFFLTLPPKALDIADLQLIPELDHLSLEDACATLEAFTAETIANSLTVINKPLPQQWILAGGGWNNPVIRQQLEERVRKRAGNQVKILLAQEAGWNSQALEAQIFAYLAVRSLQNQALSLPGTTGAPYPLTGGQIYLPRQGISPAIQALIEQHRKVLQD